jgi:predicted DNA-binding protein (MmcQ/YjbR family)
VQLQFAVENFTLTPQPTGDERSGVIAVYVDGKFFENFATTSAQITLPRRGTHFIEAELTHIDRSPFVPRTTDSLYLSVTQKTPYILIKNQRSEMTVYTDQPKFDIAFDPATFENTANYIKVFVDGEVDGSTEESGINTSYTFVNPVTPGKHSVRFVLYKKNGAPYSPVVDSTFTLNYNNNRPDITTVTMPETVNLGSDVPFQAAIRNFAPGKDGYLMVSLPNHTHYLTSPDSTITPDFQGTQKILFRLVDKNGFMLYPDVYTEKVVRASGAGGQGQNSSNFIPTGLFTTAQDGALPRINLLILATIEAIAIIVFGVFLVRRHK